MSKRATSDKHSSQTYPSRRCKISCSVCGRIFHSDRALSTHIQLSDRCRVVMRYGSTLPPDSQLLKATRNGNEIVLDPTDCPLPFDDTDLNPSSFVHENFDHLPASTEDASWNGFDNLNDSEHTNDYLPSHGLILSKELMMSIELLYLLKNAGCPLYLFDSILLWVQNAVSRGFCFKGKLPKRQMVLNLLEKRFKTSSCKPQTFDFKLEGGEKSSVVIFETQAMIRSLLNDNRLMSEEHLVISKTNPAVYQAKYVPSSKLDEIHQGSVCRLSQQVLCTSPKDVFCGIILYIDGTVMGPFTSGHLEPVMMSLTIFSRKTRYQSYAWRPIAFIDQPKGQPLDAVNGTDTEYNTKGMSTRNYHRALTLILSRLKLIQENGGLKTDLTIDGITHKDMTLKVPIVAVLCDCEEADILCGRYKSHLANITSLCRDCDCPTALADDFAIICNPRKRSDFVDASDEALKQMSHYKLNNAFDNIQMADSEEGISGCTPPEMCHWLDAGLIKQPCQFFYDHVLKKDTVAQRAFDSVLSQVSRQCQRQSDRDMPLITFNNGFAKLTNSVIKSSEYTDLMVCCILTWHTHAAQVALHGRSYTQTRDHITQFVNLFEMLLCLQKWMKSGDFDVQTIDDHEASFRKVMQTYKQVVSRTEGLGLKTTKYHQMCHIIRYIKKFGSPQNVNTARNENHHKVNAKDPAKRTQKRLATLSEQTATRYYENYVIDLAQAYINLDVWKPKPIIVHRNGIAEGTKCSVMIKSNEVSLLSMDIDFKQHVPFEIASDLLSFIASVVLNKTVDVATLCHTECHINNVLYRAHPSYRSKDAWNDWCYYKTNRMQYERIANILLFVVVNDEQHLLTGVNKGVYAIAHVSQSPPKDLSVLVKTCHLNVDDNDKPIYHLINVQDITRPAFCIKNLVRKENSIYTSEDLSQVFVMEPYNKWKNYF